MQTYRVEEREVYPHADADDPRGTFDLGDGEILLDTRRQANALLVAVATPVEVVGSHGGSAAEGADSDEVTYECGAPLTSSDGTCSRTVDGPDEHCAQHAED